MLTMVGTRMVMLTVMLDLRIEQEELPCVFIYFRKHGKNQNVSLWSVCVQW